MNILARPLERDALIDSVNKALALDSQWRQRDAECAALEERIRRLSTRDRETLQMILSGEPAKSVAARFFLSARAAKMRRSALLRKLRVHSVAELTDLTAGNEIEPEPTGSASERSCNRPACAHCPLFFATFTRHACYYKYPKVCGLSGHRPQRLHCVGGLLAGCGGRI